MSEWKDPKKVEALVHFIAHKFSRRLAARPQHTIVSFKHDDLVQEIWVTWCMARDSFDPERGVKFSTYFMRAAMTNLQRFVKNGSGPTKACAVSLDKVVGSEQDEDMTLHSVIPSADPDPETVAVEKSAHDAVMKRLSKDARLFVALLETKHSAVQREVLLSMKKQEYARQRGITTPVNTRLTTSMVFDLMGVSRRHRTRILEEIRTVGGRK